jgi:hypothetical protein
MVLRCQKVGVTFTKYGETQEEWRHSCVSYEALAVSNLKFIAHLLCQDGMVINNVSVYIFVSNSYLHIFSYSSLPSFGTLNS